MTLAEWRAEVNGQILGTVPQWLTAISALAGLTWAFLRFGLGWRGQSIDAATQFRDDLAKEIAAVRGERASDHAEFTAVEKHLRELVADSDRRHEECEANRRSMRKEMDGMHDEITGLKRQISRYSADQMTQLEGSAAPPSERTPDAAASAERVKKITGGDK